MAFPQNVKDAAYRRSGGRCECRRQGHGHFARCAQTLTKTSAEYHHVHAASQGVVTPCPTARSYVSAAIS